MPSYELFHFWMVVTRPLYLVYKYEPTFVHNKSHSNAHEYCHDCVYHQPKQNKIACRKYAAKVCRTIAWILYVLVGLVVCSLIKSVCRTYTWQEHGKTVLLRIRLSASHLEIIRFMNPMHNL